MKLNELQRLRPSSKRVIPQFSKSTLWIARFIIFILVTLWIVGGLYFHNQVKQDEQRIEQNRLEAQRQEEIKRREAQYKQALQQRNQSPRVRNVFEGR